MTEDPEPVPGEGAPHGAPPNEGSATMAGVVADAAAEIAEEEILAARFGRTRLPAIEILTQNLHHSKLNRT